MTIMKKIQITGFKKIPSKVYTGIRFDNGNPRGITEVLVNGELLYSEVSESDFPNENLYEWGYSGSMPYNLSASILADYFESTRFPEELIILFKNTFITVLPFWEWTITSDTIRDWLAYLHRQELDKNAYMECEIREKLVQSNP